MFQDVAELREFYTSPLGQVTTRILRRRVTELWPNLKGQRVLVLGYGTPLMRPMLGNAERTFALMPIKQGVITWPREGPNLTSLADETRLPLQDASVDAVILLHAIECAPHLDAMMEEVWRVLTSGGRILVIAPNRAGLWAHTDRTPFGHGAAFSSRQIRQFLKTHLFIPEREVPALFGPPSNLRFWLALAPAIEEIGRRWFKALAGVHLIEGSKQLYAPSGLRAKARQTASLMPVAKAAPAGLRRG